MFVFVMLCFLVMGKIIFCFCFGGYVLERCLIVNDVSFNRYVYVCKDVLIFVLGVMKVKFGNVVNVIMMMDKDDSFFGLNVVFFIFYYKYYEFGICLIIFEFYGLVCI